MHDALLDRLQLHRLLIGRFGKLTDLYDSITVEGEPSGDLHMIESVFGLYPHRPILRCYGFVPTPADADWFLTRIPGYVCDESHTGILGEQGALLEKAHPDWRDEAGVSELRRQAQRELTEKGLPISFFGYQIGQGGTRSVVFWYPRHAPADAMLRVFKLVA